MRPDPALDQDADESLRELRALLLGSEQSRLQELERRLTDVHVRAGDVSQVLTEAIAARSQRDRSLQLTLQPILEEVLRISVAKNPRMLADALYPVMGEAIRKSVARSLRDLIESLNQVLERRFSFQSLVWRWESITTGKPFGEIVLLRSLTYSVQQVFLIHRETGLLLQHAARDQQVIQDTDMVSGMLTAIQDFVHDSFQASKSDELETMQVGELTVWIHHGPMALLTGVISGTAPPELHVLFQKALEAIHRDFGPALAAFNGNTGPLAGTAIWLQTCFPDRAAGQARNAVRPSRHWLWIPVLLVLLIALGIAWRVRENSRWSSFLARVHQQRGIVLTSAERRDGRYVLTGMRDPLAIEPNSLASGVGVDPGRLESHFQSYLSLEPEFVQLRHNLAQKELIESQIVRFAVNSARIESAEIAHVDAAENAILDLLSNGLKIQILVRGHADSTGEQQKNGFLSADRAAAVRKLMVGRGLPNSLFTSEGVGSGQPLRNAADTDSNRRVQFVVTLPSTAK